MRIFLAGTPAMVVPLFDEVLRSDIEVCGVLTNPPKPRGRSGEPVSSPVSKWAKENGLTVFENENLEEVSQKLGEIDLVFVVAYGRIIPERFLNLPKLGWMNLHFSTLPEARGAAPVQRLIASGKNEIGFTLFKLDSGMDTGPIYFQSKPTSISGLTTGEVWAKLIAEAKGEIVARIREIFEGLPAIPQSELDYSGKIQLAPKISASEAQIDWTESAEIICRKILAFNPAPSAWSVFRSERMLIHRAQIHDNKLVGNIESGQVLTDNNSLVIACGEGALEVVDLQPSGKKVMKAQEWLRGAKVQSSERFE